MFVWICMTRFEARVWFFCFFFLSFCQSVPGNWMVWVLGRHDVYLQSYFFGATLVEVVSGGFCEVVIVHLVHN